MSANSDDPREHDAQPFDELTVELYAELRRVAANWMRGERVGHSLQATALANEAFLKLAHLEQRWQDRGHFLATASRAMCQILIDHAHARNAAKRMPPGARLPLSHEGLLVDVEDRVVSLLDMETLLVEIAERDPAMRSFVELRFFGGCTMKECAQTLDLAERTLERRWEVLRKWMFARLGTPDADA